MFLNLQNIVKVLLKIGLGSQVTKHKPNVSAVNTSSQPQHGPQTSEVLRLTPPAAGWLESPTPSNRGQTTEFEPYVLPDSPHEFKTHSVLQEPELHSHLEFSNQVSVCIVCGKPWNQVIEETVGDYLHRKRVPGEKFRDHHIKRQSFLESLSCGVIAFVSREISQSATSKCRKHQIKNEEHCREHQGKLLLLL